MEKSTFYTKTVVSIKEFAQEFGLSLPIAYRVASEPDFPLLQIGRRKLVITSGLERWMNGRAR